MAHRMKSFACLLTLALLAGCAGMMAAEKSVVGTWKCVSDTPDGDEVRWTLTITEQGGKLAGTAAGEPGEFPLIDPKLEGDTLTFRVAVEGETYTIEAKVSGTQLEGSWKGRDGHGFLKGTKQS